MRPLISIIIPVYNAEVYLKECLESIKNQSYSNFEVLIVDDGSLDNTSKISKQYEKEDNRFKYLYQDNAGPSVARNTGIKQSKGEYIWFVDADDWIEKDSLQVFVAVLKEYDYKLDIFSFDFFKEYSNKKKIISNSINGQLNNDEFLDVVLSLKNHFGLVWSGIYSAKVIKENNIFFDMEISQSEDVDFVVRLSIKANNIFIDSHALYHYRVTKESLSRKYREGIANNYLLALQKIEKCVMTCDNGALFDSFLDNVKGAVIYIILNDYFHPNNKKSYFYKCKEVSELLKIDIVKKALESIKVSNVGKQKAVILMLVKNKLFALVNVMSKIIYCLR